MGINASQMSALSPAVQLSAFTPSFPLLPSPVIIPSVRLRAIYGAPAARVQELDEASRQYPFAYERIVSEMSRVIVGGLVGKVTNG